MLTKSVKYHIERVAMRQITLSSGIQSYTWNNLAFGAIPKTLIIGIVSSLAFNGTVKETPFNFANFDLAFISADLDGTIYPSQGYSMDYTTECSLQGYEGLLDTLERLNESTGELPFDRQGYNKGFSLYGFDLTVSHTGRGALSLIRTGNLNINFRFKTQLKDAVVAVAMLTYDNTIQINNNRQVIFDFAP